VLTQQHLPSGGAACKPTRARGRAAPVRPGCAAETVSAMSTGGAHRPPSWSGTPTPARARRASAARSVEQMRAAVEVGTKGCNAPLPQRLARELLGARSPQRRPCLVAAPPAPSMWAPAS
jgi:hypothetical protein